MRDILNEVNEDNDSIHSVKLSAISYKMKDSKEKVLLQEDVWLDLSSDEMTILLTEHDVLLKIYYQAIHRFHFATKSNSAQVSLSYLLISSYILIKMFLRFC